MQVVYHPINFDLDVITAEELPYSRAFYSSQDQLHDDVKALFSFPQANAAAMPFYTIRKFSWLAMDDVFDDAYDMLQDALQRLFQAPRSTLMHYFDCAFLRKHPYFIDYAQYVFHRQALKGQALYGRFDAAFDPVSERVTGIYEFNADTPTMLFESINLQAHLLKQVADEERQFNDWWYPMREVFGKLRAAGSMRLPAVVFDQRSIEDTVTAETVAQVIGGDHGCLFADVHEIGCDLLRPEQPWVIGNDYPDMIYVLVPWEEMLDKAPKAFEDWGRWVENVSFLEPSWRWFMAHKGIWAWVTHLIETNKCFAKQWGHLPVLPTYLDPAPFLSRNLPYVSKPVLGRMSSNVQLHMPAGGPEHAVTAKTDGPYADCERVYQAYCPPQQVSGRNNFIIGMWMRPELRVNESTWCDADPATLCIREFESPFLGVENERFIPHIVVDEG